MIEHLRGRERKLEPLGWTGQDAEWIALVCLHSGVFTRAQFCHYFDTGRKHALTDSLSSLIDRRIAGREQVAAFEWRSENIPDIEQGNLSGAGR